MVRPITGVFTIEIGPDERGLHAVFSIFGIARDLIKGRVVVIGEEDARPVIILAKPIGDDDEAPRTAGYITPFIDVAAVDIDVDFEIGIAVRFGQSPHIAAIARIFLAEIADALAKHIKGVVFAKRIVQIVVEMIHGELVIAKVIEGDVFIIYVPSIWIFDRAFL